MMVKCIAPGKASHRGKPIAVAEDSSCDLSEEALEEMRGHGFREWDGDSSPEAANDPAPAIPATDDVETMSRQALMKALKGQAKGNFVAMSTDELRRLLRETAGAKPHGSE
jgi:hypothetical protein